MTQKRSKHLPIRLVAVLVSSVMSVGWSASAFAATFTEPPNPSNQGDRRNFSGKDAIDHLGERIFAKANELKIPVAELIKDILEDKSIFVDKSFNIGYADPVPVVDESSLASIAEATLETSVVGTKVPPTTATEAFDLSTDPTAPLKIYLDFNGHTTSGTYWDLGQSPITSAPFNIEGSSTTWSAFEIDTIYKTWLAVADDYAPWRVDVTTKDPGVEALRKSNSGDTAYGIRVVISPTNFYNSGGVAYVGSFNWDSDTPAFAFTDWVQNWFDSGYPQVVPKFIAEVVSHEAGHSVSLSHDGTTTGSAYYRGNVTWGPIMGAAYNPVYSVWSQGEYPDANNLEDDTTIITGYLPLRSDDHGDSAANASSLPGPGTFYGRISTATDVDAFSISFATPSSMTLSGTGIGLAPNLNIGVRVNNSAGTTIASSIRGGHSFSGLEANVAAGTYTILVSGEGEDHPDYGSLGEYRLTISTPMQILPETLPPGDTNVAYSTSLEASGGTAPYSWTKLSGSLPTGLTLSTEGLVSGTPTTAGTFDFTVRATDSVQNSTTRSYTVQIVDSLRIDTSTLPSSTIDTPYSVTLSASGGTGPYTWSRTSGSLPPGLTLSESGTISGTQSSSPGTHTFTLQVTDAQSETVSRSFTMDTLAPLNVETSTLSPVSRNTSYSMMLSASGGVGPYTWTRTSGSLPRGLTLTTNGALTGRPSSIGTSSFTVRVRDAAGRTASRSYSVTVRNPVAIGTSRLPAMTLDSTYTAALTATGGMAPYTWSISSGELPGGLDLSSTGNLSGTPTTTGSFTFTVQIVDFEGRSTNRTYTAGVAVPLIIETSQLPQATRGVTYSTNFVASGGVTPYRWSRASGSLPRGLRLSASGVLSGSPRTNGTYEFTLRVTDADGRTANVSYQFVVVLP